MRNVKRKLKRLAVLCLVLSWPLSYVGVCKSAVLPVQNSQQPSDAQIKAILADCLKKDEDLDYLTKKVAALDKLNRQNQELVNALDTQIAAQQKTIDALKAAIATGRQIEGVDDKLVASLEASVKDANAQITRLTRSRNLWRRIATAGMFTVAVIGLAVGYVMGSK